jgi:flagellar hook-length control protein FliK
MPPMIMPPVAPNAGGQAVSQAGSRSRSDADEAQGRGFGAALERSRHGNRQETKTADAASGAATAERKPGRKSAADEDTKDALPPAPNLAFLAPPNTPLHALTLAGRAGRAGRVDAQGDGTAAATGVATAAGAGAATDIPADPALQDALAKLMPDAAAAGAGATAADAKAAPDAALAAKDGTRPAAARPDLPSAANADTTAATATAPIAALQDVVRAAVAAQTAGVANRPAAASAGPATGTAASGRAAPRAVSATTAEQLASAAQSKPADDTGASVTAAAVPATTAAQPGANETGTQDTATPFVLQQAGATAAPADRTTETAAARAPVHTVAPEVGSDKWAPALGQQLARMSTSGQHTAELSLNPAGLGPLKVTLSLGDNQAQAMFVSAHESVRKAVEAALPQLRTSLSEQGITLGQASVGADTRQPFGNDAAFAQQQQQQNGGRQQASSYPGAGRTAPAAQATPVAPVRQSTAGTAGAGVDTFA